MNVKLWIGNKGYLVDAAVYEYVSMIEGRAPHPENPGPLHREMIEYREALSHIAALAEQIEDRTVGAEFIKTAATEILDQYDPHAGKRRDMVDTFADKREICQAVGDGNE